MTNTHNSQLQDLVSETVLWQPKRLKIYLSEYSYTDVLTAGFIDERVQLIGGKRTEK